MADSIGFDPVAWAIDGGLLDGELYRIAAYAATSGSEGVITPGDNKASATSTPSGQVAIATGATVIRDRHPNVRNQSYIANGRLQSLIDVPSKGAGASRSDLLILQVYDPEYGDVVVTEAEASNYQYVRPRVITNVPATTRKLTEISPNIAGYALARIDRPAAATSIVLPEQVVDLRKVANPRRERKLTTRQFGEGSVVHDADFTDAWKNWPNASIPIDIPEWATEMIVNINIGGVWLPSASVGLAIRGAYSVFNGPTIGVTQSLPVVETGPTVSRVSFEVADQIAIPAADRGTTRYLYTQANKYTGSAGGTGVLRAGNGTRVVYDVEFLETAV